MGAPTRLGQIRSAPGVRGSVRRRHDIQARICLFFFGDYSHNGEWRNFWVFQINIQNTFLICVTIHV